jgi:hypothetical protein
LLGSGGLRDPQLLLYGQPKGAGSGRDGRISGKMEAAPQYTTTYYKPILPISIPDGTFSLQNKRFRSLTSRSAGR